MNLVITGNPGVGKHTIAELFLKHDTSYQILDINRFAIENGFGEKINGDIEVDTTKLKNEIQKLNLNLLLVFQLFVHPQIFLIILIYALLF